MYRRILHFHLNAETGRISSAAFMRKKRFDPEVSVFVARLADPGEILDAGLPQQHLAMLTVQAVYDTGLTVELQPTERFPAHAVILDFGANWKEQCARLAAASRLAPGPQSPPSRA